MYKTIRIGKLKTSKLELIDIAKAWLAISLAFALVFSGITLLNGKINNIFSISFGVMFLISLFTAGIGFLLHELAHKFAAQRYGCVAEFRAFDQMLYLAVGLAALVGFIFAAPGAVMIAGQITRKENGIISLAGPATNFVLGLIFLGLVFLYPAGSFIFLIGFQINFWLGLFNLIPFGNFDGKKILQWNNYVWLAMVAVGVYFLFFL
ncbi:MAG: metalloprotease [Nanoarchaeota archaeon]|nr:metalloprotease [Nanoarchaeota archaeon]MBU1623286.1 metalloprotease [Nanoarchaeota archaeon]